MCYWNNLIKVTFIKKLKCLIHYERIIIKQQFWFSSISMFTEILVQFHKHNMLVLGPPSKDFLCFTAPATRFGCLMVLLVTLSLILHSLISWLPSWFQLPPWILQNDRWCTFQFKLFENQCSVFIGFHWVSYLSFIDSFTSWLTSAFQLGPSLLGNDICHALFGSNKLKNQCSVFSCVDWVISHV